MVKMINRVAASVLAFVLVLSVSSVAGAAAGQTDRPALQFRPDGTFKILQIADTQDTDQLHIGTKLFIEAALDEVQPDLVVFTGDNHVGWWPTMNKTKLKAAIDAIVSPVNDRGIPFAVVPGNHDNESIKWGVTLKDQLDMYMAYPTCVAVDDGKLTGCSTYNLLVTNSAGTKDIFNIYMVDSGGYKLISKEQDLVAPDQIEWYRNKSDELKALNGGVVMPSLLFQHIPVPEFYTELMTEVPQGTPEAIPGKGCESGKYFLPDVDKYISGSLGENPSISAKNVGFYGAWVEKGDIVAAFFGHDHHNDYIGKTDDNITLGYCRGAGFHSYGSGTARGVRSFTLYEDDLKNFDTSSILYRDIVSTEMPVMPVYTIIPFSENYDFAPDIIRFFSYMLLIPARIITCLGKIF